MNLYPFEHTYQQLQNAENSLQMSCFVAELLNFKLTTSKRHRSPFNIFSNRDNEGHKIHEIYSNIRCMCRDRMCKISMQNIMYNLEFTYNCL